MKQFTINAHYASVFGLDVHARSIFIIGFERATGEVRKKRFNDCPDVKLITTWIKENFSAPYYAAYESGCTGFDLCKKMRAEGIDTDVIAVSSIARSTDDRQRKTDKLDARRLLAELLAPMSSYSVVWMPDDCCEAARDLARCRVDAVVALKRAKQQLLAFLLRHGYVWNEKTPTGNLKSTWTREHWAWIERTSLAEKCANDVLESYKRAVKECSEQANDLSALVKQHSQDPRWKPYVDAFCLLMGIDTHSAFLAACTFGDFTRFSNGRSVSKWLGTVPKENSSGEHVAHGHITKAGDSHLRLALIEGCAAICMRKATVKKPKAGSAVLPHIAKLCADANKRIKARFKHLHETQKIHTNKAKVAAVSELVRWIWIIGIDIQRGGGEC